jgi:hypothetical protein
MTGEVLSLAATSQQFTCRCDGFGWYLATDSQGREVRHRCVSCTLGRFARRVGRAGDRSWDNWQTRPELVAQVRDIRAWPGTPWAMCLHAGHGATNLGSGKTHALIATGREWIIRGADPKYHAVADIVNLSRRAIGDESVSVPDVESWDDLVLLDDLGAEAPTPYAAEIVDRIADERYRHGYPTLIATNLSLAELEARYRRVADRLCEGRLLEWAAPSWRRL